MQPSLTLFCMKWLAGNLIPKQFLLSGKGSSPPILNVSIDRYTSLFWFGFI